MFSLLARTTRLRPVIIPRIFARFNSGAPNPNPNNSDQVAHDQSVPYESSSDKKSEDKMDSSFFDSQMKKADKPDGIKFVFSEHARFRALFSDIQGTTEWDTKLRLIRDMISEISTHATNESKYLYDLIKEKLPREEMLSQRLIMDNHHSNEILAFLDKHRSRVDTADDRILYDITVGKFIANEIDHMEHEEQMLLKSLNDLMSEEEKEKLENDMRWGKDQILKIETPPNQS